MTKAAFQNAGPKDWTNALKAGDVVMYTWPLIDPAPGQRPKQRPSLVVGIVQVAGERHAEIAFGTGRMKRRRAGDPVVMDPRDLRCAGVRKPTRFDLGRQAVVALDDPAFVVSRSAGTAVIGAMPGRNILRPRRRTHPGPGSSPVTEQRAP